MKYYLGPFISGVLFSIGLGVSGMTEAKNIIAFLDVFGDWDPMLLFVMGGALVVFGVGYQLIIRRNKPSSASNFSLPTNKAVDLRLVIGAAIFGMGWGLSGLCPGPGLVALVSGQNYAIVFVLTLLIGMGIGRSPYGQRWLSRSKNL